MKASLRRILRLSLGLATAAALSGFATGFPIRAVGQELEFRPVPRPAAAAPATSVPSDPVAVGGVVPASFTARGKIVEDTPNFTAVQGDPTKAPEPLKVPGVPTPLPMPTQVVPTPTENLIPRPMPPMPGGEFVPPAPTGVPGHSGTVVRSPSYVTQPTIVSQPTIVGQPTIIAPGGTGGMSGMPHAVSGGGDCGSCGSSCGSCDSCGSCCDSCGMGLFRNTHTLWNHLFGGSCDTCAPPCGDCCAPCAACCDPCGTCCGPRSMFWVRGEYLIYSFSRQNSPPLVTTAPTTPQLPLGAGGATAFGGDDLPHSPFTGGRFNVGFWFPQHSDWGLDVTGIYFATRSVNYSLNAPNGEFAIGRPFFETSTFQGPPPDPTNTHRAEITTGRGMGLAFGGGIAIDAETRAYGFDPNLRRKLWCGPNFFVDGLIGYRYFRLDDSITIREDINGLDAATINNMGAARILVRDNFATRNTFNGGQLGLEGEWQFRPRLSLGGTFKLAVGNVSQQASINGSTTFINTTDAAGALRPPGGQTLTTPIGFFATQTNSGTRTRNQFAVMPELGIKLNVDLTDHLRLYAGYNVMCLSSVMRAGEQIDYRVNSSQAPVIFPTAVQPGVLSGQPTPAVLMKTSEFWAQGVNFGMEYHY